MSGHDAARSELRIKLIKLRSAFAAGLVDRLAAIEESAVAAEQGAELNGYRHLLRLLHTMAGSAGTFGYDTIGLAAKTLEHELHSMLHEARDKEARKKVFHRQLVAFLTMARARCGSSGEVAPIHSPPTEKLRGCVVGRQQLVFVIDDDEAMNREVSLQLEHFGYQVKLIRQVTDLAAHIALQVPAAIIMNLKSDEAAHNDANELSHLLNKHNLDVPSIIVSASSSFTARLTAVQVGAAAYIPKPIDIPALCETLDCLTGRNEKSPYRILIVEDDAIVGEHYAAILRSVGMDVQHVSQPALVLNILASFSPELVLMDVYMPECNGIEIVKMIRQDGKYVDLPIVFLSSESDSGRQIDAVSQGADEFLSKPVKTNHLISSVATRIERFRAVRGLISRDGLTRLYNHSATKELLMRELSKANRSRSTLAVAMIDLDFFKQVNDSYGHAVGDQVIRELAKLLQRCVRRSDIVGRYGGEEFLVVFPNTLPNDAVLVLEKVRQSFSQILHHGGVSEFSISFSAGIAGMDLAADIDTLLQLADTALYRAKSTGRDRIEVASPKIVSGHNVSK